MKTKNLKIAIISSSAPPYGGGGISSAHYNLYQELKVRQIDVKIFTFNDHGVKRNNNEDENIIRHGTPKFLVSMIKAIFFLIFNIIDFKKIAYQTRDIFEAAIGSYRINHSIKRYKPNIIIVGDHGCPGYFIKKRKSYKIIFISHHNPMRFIDNPLLGEFSKKDAIIANKIENKSLKKVDHVLCPSNYMMEEFKKTYTFDKEISVIPNIVNRKTINSIQRKDIRAQISLDKESILIYIPSAGNQIKGSNYVFEIIRRLSSCTEKEIGFYLSGKINPKLKHELKFIPKNIKIFYPGKTDYKTNISIIKSCSLTISPTLIESFGMAILESIICNVPVIAFNVGGNNDIIKHGKNGFLVDYLDVDKLIDYGRKLILKDNLRQKIKESIRTTSNENINSDLIVNQLLNIIDNDLK